MEPIIEEVASIPRKKPPQASLYPELMEKVKGLPVGGHLRIDYGTRTATRDAAQAAAHMATKNGRTLSRMSDPECRSAFYLTRTA